MGWGVEDVDEPENSITELDEEEEAPDEENVSEEEPQPEEPESSSEDSGGEAKIGDFDVSAIAPNAMTHEQAVETPNLHSVLVWADPGEGKTHFAYTMPNPVCIIDTEGKADDIAHKFDGTGNGDPFVFQPENYDEAVNALNQCLDILRAFEEEYGVKGTVAVDSMSIMWEWSKQKYVEKYYSNQDPSDVELTSGIGGGQSDWKKIKSYHNEKFRSKMQNCGYNVCWTAMREDDLSEKLEKSLDYTPDKPAGEKTNIYKVNTIIRIHRRNEEGIPEGVLEKSGKVKYRYRGLEYPTFDKHEQILNDLEDVEYGDKEVMDVEGEHDVEVFEGLPRYYDEDEE